MAPAQRKRVATAKTAPEAVEQVDGADAPLDAVAPLAKPRVKKIKTIDIAENPTKKAKDTDIASIMCALGGRLQCAFVHLLQRVELRYTSVVIHSGCC